MNKWSQLEKDTFMLDMLSLLQTHIYKYSDKNCTHLYCEQLQTAWLYIGDNVIEWLENKDYSFRECYDKYVNYNTFLNSEKQTKFMISVKLLILSPIIEYQNSCIQANCIVDRKSLFSIYDIKLTQWKNNFGNSYLCDVEKLIEAMRILYPEFYETNPDIQINYTQCIEK